MMAIRWIRENLFNSKLNSFITISLILIFYYSLFPILNWLLLDSVWNGTAADCREATGACWSFIQEKWRFMVFGRYPYEEQWRPGLCMLLFLTLILITKNRDYWRPLLGVAWLTFILATIILLQGGILGLTSIDISQWGGLPLTLLLSTVGIVVAYPLGILLALGRRSQLPIIKTLCVIYIEFIRGVPLITLLFMGSVVLPLFLPQDVTLNELIRAQVAIILFAAAYLAEVVRGGLQAIPPGQTEAAQSLGLSTLQTLRFVTLPQALTLVIPVTVSTFIELFKDTSLVLIVSLMDLMLATKTATIDATWQGYSTEAYLFTATIYFICCFAMAKYAKRLELELNKARQNNE